MSSRAPTDLVDDEHTPNDVYPLVSVCLAGEIHILHNSYGEMSRDMRPFRNWMRCIDMIPDGETYEQKYTTLLDHLFHPPEEVVDLKNVVETVDTIRNSRNRSNKKCIGEIFGTFKGKCPGYEPKIDACCYSLQEMIGENDAIIIYGVIRKESEIYRFEISILVFSGIVKRRTVSGKFKVVPSGRYGKI